MLCNELLAYQKITLNIQLKIMSIVKRTIGVLDDIWTEVTSKGTTATSLVIKENETLLLFTAYLKVTQKVFILFEQYFLNYYVKGALYMCGIFVCLQQLHLAECNIVRYSFIRTGVNISI